MDFIEDYWIFLGTQVVNLLRHQQTLSLGTVLDQSQDMG